MLWPNHAGQLREIINKGVLGAGAFQHGRLRWDYEEAKGQGSRVLFPAWPKDRMVSKPFSNNSGNCFSSRIERRS